VSYFITATLTRPNVIAPTTSCYRHVKFQDSIDIGHMPVPKPRVISLEPISKRGRVKAEVDHASLEKTTPISKINTDSSTYSNRLVSDIYPPQSPTPSEDTAVSRNSNSTISFQIVNHTDSADAPSRKESDVPSSITSTSSQTITATTELEKQGALPGDTIPVRVTVLHNKLNVRGLVIATLYRQGRVDLYPGISLTPKGKNKKAEYEDNFPRSESGLGGLHFSNISSSSVFRKDLSQSTAMIIVNPRTLTADVRTSIKLPENAFPTMSNVPGSMITFKYYVEVVVDLCGKLANHDLPRLTSMEPSFTDGAENISQSDSDWANNILDTFQLRQTKGVVDFTFAVLVGTKDSGRTADRRAMEDNNSQEQMATEFYPDRLGDEEYYDGYGEWDGLNKWEDFEHAHVPERTRNPPSITPIPPPPPPEEPIDEKEWLRRLGALLLPGQPPDGGGLSMAAEAATPSAPLIPEDVGWYDYRSGFDGEAGPPTYHVAHSAVSRRSVDTIVYGEGAGSSHDQDPPTFDENTSHRPQDDKQDLERQKLMAQASAPLEEGDGVGTGPQSSANEHMPTAPVLDEAENIMHIHNHEHTSGEIYRNQPISLPTPLVPLDGSGDGAVQFGSSSPVNRAETELRVDESARSLEPFERGDFRPKKGISMIEMPPAARREQMHESQKPNAIKSSEQRKDDLIQAFLSGERDLPQSQVDNIVRQLVDERSSNTLTAFLEYKPDTVGRLFPWAPALLHEGFSCAEVSELIINSENLQWLESEPWIDGNDRSWAQGYSPSHLDSCAHEICGQARKWSRRAGSAVTKTEQSLSESDIDSSMVSESEVALHQGESATVHSSSSRSSLSDLEDQFSKLEQREHNMTSICGTAGVFPPASRPRNLNPGFAEFEGAIAKILYAESEQASEGAAVKTELAGHKEASRISCALDNVIYAISKLNRDGGCCDSFSIFVHCSGRPRIVRTSTISRHMIESLQNCLKGCVDTDFADRTQLANLAKRCRDIFSTLGQSRIAEGLLRSRSVRSFSTKCRHLCALVAQIASLGIVTYTRGHSREFVCNELSRSVEKFFLLGTGRADISVTAARVTLTCLDAMLSRPVWAFQLDGREAQNQGIRFSFSTSIEHLLDLWGGRLSFLDVPDDPGIIVQVGGGTLTEAPIPAHNYRGAVLCHWSPSIVPDAVPIALQLDEQIIIGATLVNNECSLSADLCHSHISGSLEILGARSPRWKITGRNVGLSGGQFITATMGVTQTKDNGRTRKARILEHWKDHKSLKILNEPVGLELSLCTGVARRVPLRTLFHSQVLEYFTSALDNWKQVSDQASEGRVPVAHLAALIGETTTNAEMHILLDDVHPEQAEVLRKATELLLLAMECTGVADDGESLVMWWPETETLTPRGLKIPKRYYSASSKHGPWTSMIKDSESCAVFGMITSRCLQHHGVRPCQTLGQGPISYKFPEQIILDTSLSPAGRGLEAVLVSYELGQRLMLWQCKEILRVIRAAQKGEDVVRLELYAALPPAVARLIGSKWKLVREQQALKDQGQNVLVL
jgi:arrestin-related trafficking adapter 9